MTPRRIVIGLLLFGSVWPLGLDARLVLWGLAAYLSLEEVR